VKLIIIVVGLLLLAGGGTYGVSMFAPGLLPAPVAAMLGAAPPEDGEAMDAEPEKPTDTALIDMDPITIPLFADGDVDRFLVIEIFLEVEAGPDVLYVNGQMTRIVDAIITHTHALAALDIEPGIQDRAFLKARLLAKIQEVIGDGYVVDILFENLFERPLQ